MQIAKVDSNNIVVNTIAINDSKIIDKYGSITFENCQLYCNEFYKDSNIYRYIPEIRGVTIGEPNVGFVYNHDRKMFHDVQPFNSWTLNDNGLWQAPYDYVNTGDMHGKILWNEGTQRWVGKLTANFGKVENPDYVCDPVTKLWSLL
jgi:hypothetical protein